MLVQIRNEPYFFRLLLIFVSYPSSTIVIRKPLNILRQSFERCHYTNLFMFETLKRSELSLVILKSIDFYSRMQLSA